eukprot:2681784-Rhodomonas_salina.1
MAWDSDLLSSPSTSAPLLAPHGTPLGSGMRRRRPSTSAMHHSCRREYLRGSGGVLSSRGRGHVAAPLHVGLVHGGARAHVCFGWHERGGAAVAEPFEAVDEDDDDADEDIDKTHDQAGDCERGALRAHPWEVQAERAHALEPTAALPKLEVPAVESPRDGALVDGLPVCDQ